ncbi:MAG TPA: cobalt transporter CbiM [Candidatus Hydrogenedentes bacterium]|nr:cobalt transporter CbiM [Candidatus Hydrogenedentota bacterium]
MHIPDGVLSGAVAASTGALGVAGVFMGLRKMDYEHIARVGLLSAVFFVGSLIHVPIPPASAHLLLVGLIGILLGWAAFPALLVALLLQAVLFGFGGLTSLGANVVIMASPAVACHGLFASRIARAASPRIVFALAFVAGATGIMLSCMIAGAALFLSGREFLGAVGAIVIGHVPVMLIEGFVTGSAVAFVHNVRPELLEAPLAGAHR